MRVLAVDAGNTRIKWALFDDASRAAYGWLWTRESATLAAAIAGVAVIDRAVACNVAGDRVQHDIAAAVAGRGARALWLEAREAQCGVKSGYARPAQLGPDRWAALIAVRGRYEGPCVVVNAGTTVTIDALSGEGVFLGGCIVPGVELMQDALHRNTAKLARAPGRFSFFPDNTADAMASGAINALAGAVDRVVGYLLQAGEQEPLVVLSGGAAEILAPHLNQRVERVDDLVLQGLLSVALEQEQQEANR